jgi:MFS family permease
MNGTYRTEFTRGWRALVAAGLGYGTGVGLLIYANGFFMRYLQADFGWSREQISAASLIAVLSAVLNVAVGHLVDRFTARRVAVFAIPLFCLGYVALAAIPGELWAFYAAMAWLFVVGTATGPVAYTKVVNGWFVKQRGLALGLTLAGISAVSFGLFPVLSYVLETYGWRAAYLLVGGASLVLGYPVVLAWLREPPHAPEALRPSLTPDKSRAWAHPAFWLLFLAMVAANVAVGGFVQHMQPLLGDRGVAPETAALLGSLYVAMVALGRIATGFLLDRLRPGLVATATMLVPAASVLLLLNPSAEIAVLALPICLLAFAQGAEVELLAFFTPRYFGMDRYASVFGMLIAVVVMAGPAGGIIFGRIFDQTGSYDLAFKLAAACFLVAALAFAGLFLVPDRTSQGDR